MKYSRGSFLKTLGLGGLAASTGILHAVPRKDFSGTDPKGENTPRLTIGLASYSTRNYTLDETLAMARRLNIEQIALKSIHMPLESSEEEIRAIVEKIENAGVQLYGVGVIYMKSAEEVENAFRYAKAARVNVIIGVPNHDLLEMVEAKVKETDIKLAIHNHGPGDDVYPTPEVVYDKVKTLDSRIGLCIDIGHVKRLGLDPVENIKKYADRLYDLHLKDVNLAATKGTSVAFGRGVIDLPAVHKALIEINYNGVMAMEFEKDADDVLPGLAECVGYSKGVLGTL